MFKNCPDLNSPAEPVRQIWVSGPVQSGNSYAQSSRALFYMMKLETPQPLSQYIPSIFLRTILSVLLLTKDKRP